MDSTTIFPLEYVTPIVTETEVAAFVRSAYGLEGALTPLAGERDRNFRLDATTGASFVVKVASASDDAGVLAMQDAALEHVARHDPALIVPRVVRQRHGAASALTTAAGEVHRVRLVGWIAGVPLADVRPRTQETLRSLGEWLGRLDTALAGFAHPAAGRALKWDLAHAAWALAHMDRIESSPRRLLAQRMLAPFIDDVLPHWPELPAGVIHNDANDYNVLVDAAPADPRRTLTVVDFGDMVHTAIVTEVAIAAAYAMMGMRDPVAAACCVVAGYHERRALGDLELRVLDPLIRARLVVSVVNAAMQRGVTRTNDYLAISEAPAWALLERLEREHARLVEYRLRAACGLEPVPAAPRVRRWLHDHAAAFTPILTLTPTPEQAPGTGPGVTHDAGSSGVRLARIDLSVGSPLADDARAARDEPRLTRRILAQLEAAGAHHGIGEYGEVRLPCAHDAFRTDGWDGPEWRSVHLGLDIYARPGTAVFAPLEGLVRSVADNAGAYDYGPTVILEHQVADDDGPFVFLTLWGHLERETLARLRPGDRIRRGEEIGRIGNASVNGGWSPHVHVQIIADMLDGEGTFPGLARPSDRAVWQSLSPSPLGLAALPYAPAPVAPGTAALLERRRHLLGGNLSVAYRRPLHIVRGWMQHLFDADGRRYLDAVNNVPHVGHSHPRVLQAARDAMAVLNTNTRYLHPAVLRYAERLQSTLPAPLGVFFFVNSGSEANELALRLAWTHTGRQGTVVLDGAYHGNTTTLVSLSPYKCDGPGGRGLAPYARKLPLPDTYRGLYRGADPANGERYARHVEAAIAELESAGTPVAAFLCESIVSCGGQIVPPPGFLAAVYARVRRAGGVTIADEVQTGFGRAGTHFWAFAAQEVVPDIVVMGKPAGNGHPLGIVATTPEIAASFANGMEYFSTFGGNPVSSAIGLAVLDVIAEEGLQARARDTGSYLLDGLRSLTRRHAQAGDARGLGLFLGLELVRDPASREPHPRAASHVANRLREMGILVSTDGPDHNVIKIKPPLCFGRDDADALLAALDCVLCEDAVTVG